MTLENFNILISRIWTLWLHNHRSTKRFFKISKHYDCIWCIAPIYLKSSAVISASLWILTMRGLCTRGRRSRRAICIFLSILLWTENCSKTKTNRYINPVLVQNLLRCTAHITKRESGDFSVVQQLRLCLPIEGVRIWSLAEELRSHRPQIPCAAGRGQKFKK